MKAHAWDWLPVLFVLVAACLALRGEPRHETCNNEKRYENQVMCAGVQFGYRAPYPDNCSLYLVCDCEYPTVLPCPGQLWWNNETQNCDWPQNTKCLYYTIDTTPKTTKATTAATTPSSTVYTPPTTTPMSSTTEENWPSSSYDPPPPPPGIPYTFCRNLTDGSVHRYPYDCNAYINCTHGYPVLNYCEPDKVFNQVLLICDTPETAECEPLPLPSTTTEHPTETTTAEPTTTTEDGECGAPPYGIEADYCVPLGDGFYEYPYDCSAYISCRHGCTDKDYCIPDKLFNPILHICDTPDSVHCNPKPYPTTTVATTPGSTEDTSSSTNAGKSTTPVSSSSTTTVATTTTPALPADVDPDLCKGLPDYTRFPYAADCSQFLQCSNNQVVVGQCAEPLLFNPDFLICDSADDVICYGDRTTTTSTTSTTEAPTTTTSSTTVTTTPTTTPGPAELCANEPFYATFPYVQDCTSYILCLGDGEFYIAKCISNTYYDPKTGDCGPNVSPTACREQDTTTTRTTTEKTTTEPVTSISTPTTSVGTTTSPTPVQPGGICGNRDEGELIAYPNDCSKYIVCVTPIPVAFYCRPGSYFSAKQQQCVSWEDSDCDKDTATTPGYTGPPLEPTMCTNSSRDTFPYPENCQWFIRCVNDYIYMMDVCNCSEYYDPISGKCGADVPSDACRWDYTSTTTEATPTPTTTEPTHVTRPPPQKGPCDDAADGELVPYPNDCSKYIKCDHPIAAAYDCDDGDEFSPVLRECMEASLANCTVGTTPDQTDSTTLPTTPIWPGSTTGSITTSSPVSTTSPETSTTSKTSTTPETSEPNSSTTLDTTTTQKTTTPAPSGGICSGKPDGTLVPYPNNCGKYIVCQEPIPIGYDCPENLEFSPTELECMDPELANCEPKPTTAATTTDASTTPSSTTTETTPTTTESTTTPSLTPPITPTTTPETTASTTSETTVTDSTSTTPEKSTITTLTTEPTTTPSCNTSPNTTPITPTTTPETTASTTPETTVTDSTSTTPETSTITTLTTESTTTPACDTSPNTTPITPTTTPETTASTTAETTVTDSTSTTPEKSTITTLTTEPTTTPSCDTSPNTTPITPTTSPETTASTTSENTSTTEVPTPKTTTPATPTIHPDTPNICCGHPLGTILPYPNDCNRYVVCDYPIPYAVVCEEGTVFDVEYLQCTTNGKGSCI
ncbi:mucin-2 [Drosophila montana]|uniref:mucin-2 n=1 Tax=Drosophila montana TaxID=40370 RepID=UPI00313C8F32